MWVVLATLPSCGTSDPKSTASGGANPGASGGSATEGGSGSSEAGSNGSPGGHPGLAGAGGNGGASNAAGAGAGGGAGGGTAEAPPDISTSTLLTALDDTQRGALCDWHANVLGGYGHVSKCGMVSITFYANQSECVSKLFATYCAKANVGEFVGCASAKIPSDGCDYPYDQCHSLYCM